MGTPFKPYTNLTLKIPVTGQTMIEDPVTGNMVYEITEKIYKASVDVNSHNRREHPGIDSQALYLEGNLTFPKFLDKSVSGNMKVKAILIDPATKNQLEGEFLFDLPVQTRFRSVTKVLGSELKGWFTSYH